jgi:hypothetical protein
MKIEDQLFEDMVLLAKLGFESLTEEEIQEWYGSDYYVKLKKYLYQCGYK